MNIVVDASVALKWFLPTEPKEEHVEIALGLLERVADGRVGMVQPPHFVAEVAAVLVRLKPRQAEADLDDLLAIGQRTLATPEVYATALDLALRLQHHVFDTLYHAVALHTPGAEFVTADKRYYNKAKALGGVRWIGGVGMR